MPLNEILAILLLVSFFVLLMAGIPVALTLASAGFIFGYLGFGPLLFNLLPNRIFGVVTNYTLIAMPLFVFMGVMLEKSKLAEELMEVIGHAAGALRGGLGIGIIVVGVLMGATTGIVGATVVTLGLLTLPTLLRRGYDKGLACGIICASGTLGQIIPPSLILILLADIMNESVGTSSGSASCGRRWCPQCRARSATSSRAPSSSASCCGSCCRRLRWSAPCSARSSAASRRRQRRPRWAPSAPSW
jgi:TRAP-type mannitol/chloroaromatic compound transport system permease large subunit